MPNAGLVPRSAERLPALLRQSPPPTEQEYTAGIHPSVQCTLLEIYIHIVIFDYGDFKNSSYQVIEGNLEKETLFSLIETELIL